MTDFLLEALDQGLFTSITDNGAGGLSSSVGEMARATGGATIDLARAKLKYPGLMPWEILLSEAQERMTVGIPPDLLDAFLALAARREVEAAAIGTFTDSGYFHVLHDERTVALLEMEFLHDGLPEMRLSARWNPPTARPLPAIELSPEEALREILARENIASKEAKSRQYDHEVKARTVIKPFTGVFLVDYERPEGVVLSEGINPWYSDLDTRHMAMAVVDEAVRRLVAGGARPGTISALDNFCWPDPVESEITPDGQYKLAQLVRACQGLHEACVAFGVPLISGKDSMKNDSTRGGVKISIPPTLLLSAMGRIDDVALAQTPEPKAIGDLLYIVGETAAELGASEFARWIESRHRDGTDAPRDAAVGGSPPVTDPVLMRTRYGKMSQAIAEGVPASVKTPSLGGVAVALAWMAFGAELGLKVDLDAQPVTDGLDLWNRLFSESSGRFLVTVPPSRADRFEDIMAGEPVARLGIVDDPGRLVITFEGTTIIDSDVPELKNIWQAPLARF